MYNFDFSFGVRIVLLLHHLQGPLWISKLWVPFINGSQKIVGGLVGAPLSKNNGCLASMAPTLNRPLIYTPFNSGAVFNPAVNSSSADNACMV